MAADNGYDPIPGFRAWLERVEGKIDATATKVDSVEKQVLKTNGRVNDLEEDLHGHPEERRRGAQPGLLARFGPIEQAHKDQKAVRRALWSAVTLLSSAFVLQLLLIAMQMFGGK